MTPFPPFGQRARRRLDHVAAEHGWGPQLTWRVPRQAGEPLVFQLRVPTGVDLIELDRLVESTSGAPQSVLDGAAALRHAGESAGAFLLAGICNVPGEGKPREVAATVSVALAEITGPPDPRQFTIEDSETTVRSDVEVVKLSEKVTFVRRLSLESVDPGAEPTPMLVVQYLIESRYGALVMAFSTTRGDMMGEWGLKLYEGIVNTAYIGERPAPY